MSHALRLFSAFAFVVGLMAWAAPATASDQWTLIQAVGEVSVAAPGATPVAVKPSMALPDGATVKTGPSGRAVLLRGRETIVMSPSSAITLPSGAKRDFTKVRQQSGTLLFKIGKKPEAHFEVDTPYLAAVVKGTTFTVKVGAAGASVHVLEGAVEVATVDRKNSFLTRTGQISSVFARTASEIFTTGASLLNGPAGNAELWGTDVSGADIGGESSPWTLSSETRTFSDTGLKAHAAKPKKTEALTERAPERLAQAAKSVDDTMGAAKARKQTHKPKDGLARTQAEDAADARARDPKVNQRDTPSAKKPERKTKDPVAPKAAGPAPKTANVWTVTQARGDITIDGYPFTNFGDGLVRTLPPGTKVETGPDSRLGVAHGMKEFVVEANSVAILADALEAKAPMVVSGAALQYREESGRYEAVANLTPDEVAALQASGALDKAPAQGGGAPNMAAGPSGGPAVAATPSVPAPKTITMQNSGSTKTEEVRTKVIGSLTLGLYGLTALLVLTFGAQWVWRRYRTKKKEGPAETVAQTRLRTIKGV